MIQKKYKILNGAALTVLLIICCGFQSSLWFQLMGGIPSPQLWLLVFLYIALYRPYFEAVMFSYFLCLFVRSFSAVTLGMLFPCFFILISLTNFVKRKLFWSNTRYFVMASVVFTICYQFIYYALSFLFDDNPVGANIFNHLVEISLTGIVATPLYQIFIFIDRWTLPEMTDIPGDSL